MNTFGQYLKYKKGDIILVSLLLLQFTVFLFLYQLPVEAAVYPVMVGTVLGGGFLLFDYHGKKKKYDRLKKLIGRTELLIDELPDSTSIQEEQYAQLVMKLGQEASQASAADTGKHGLSDSSDCP